jgi:hypothetical protein
MAKPPVPSSRNIAATWYPVETTARSTRPSSSKSPAAIIPPSLEA